MKNYELKLSKAFFITTKYIKAFAFFISALYILGFGFYISPWVTSTTDELLLNEPWLESGLDFGKEIVIPIIEFGVSLIPLWALLFFITISVFLMFKSIYTLKQNYASGSQSSENDDK